MRLVTMLAVFSVFAAVSAVRFAYAAGAPDPRSSAAGRVLTVEALVVRGLSPGTAGANKKRELQVDALVARGLAPSGKSSKPLDLTTDPLVVKGLPK